MSSLRFSHITSILDKICIHPYIHISMCKLTLTCIYLHAYACIYKTYYTYASRNHMRCFTNVHYKKWDHICIRYTHRIWKQAQYIDSLYHIALHMLVWNFENDFDIFLLFLSFFLNFFVIGTPNNKHITSQNNTYIYTYTHTPKTTHIYITYNIYIPVDHACTWSLS